MKNGKGNIVSVAKSTLNIDLTARREEAMAIFADVCKNKNISVSSPEEAMTVYLKAQELGIGFGNALDHMHVINGKTGIDIHIVKAILLKAGAVIRWYKTKDYTPHYQYSDGNDTWLSEHKPNQFIAWLKEQDPWYNDAVYCKGGEEFTAAKQAGKIPVGCTSSNGKLTPFDYITEYVFERVFEFNGETDIRKEVSRFSINEAMRVERNTKDTSIWRIRPELMTDHRTFTQGARAIASDLLLGCYETSELYDINEVDYLLDANGNVIKKDAPDDGEFKECDNVESVEAETILNKE